MPQTLGRHHARIAGARTLLTKKGREEQQAFSFEGPTLLAEALASGLHLTAVFATPEAWEREAVLQAVDQTKLFLVDPSTLRHISDVSTPTGIVAITPFMQTTANALLAATGPLLLLGALSDPGNAGTLLRSAEAFGMSGALFLTGGIDPFHPKVVRSAMGSLFRLPFAVVTPRELADHRGERPLLATAKHGTPLPGTVFPSNPILAVGHERHGLPNDLPPPALTLAIPHIGPTESLNAAIAGSIVMYALSCRHGNLT